MTRSPFRLALLVGVSVALAVATLPAHGAGATESGSAAAPGPVTWVLRSPSTSPSPLGFGDMVFDTALGKTVMYGNHETWTYDGNGWVQQFPAQHPSAAYGSMAYDPQLAEIVFFAGQAPPAPTETWTYNGTTWTKQTPTVSPPAGTGGAMAFDASTGILVMFGGPQDTDHLHGETWTYNGATWTQQAPVTSPPGRVGGALAFDAATGRIVLFGGYVGDQGICQLQNLGDTWTYDGTNWQQVSSTGPTAALGASLAFDAATGEMLLYGVFVPRQPSYCHYGYTTQTWSFDGTTWTQRHPTVTPPADFSPATDYDPTAKQVLLLGDFGAGQHKQTWGYQVAGSGYRLVASDGGVFAFSAPFAGSSGGLQLAQPIVGMAPSPNGRGYWLAATDGGVFAYGAPSFGSAAGLHLPEPVVAIAAPPNGESYWLATRNGDVYKFGVGVTNHGPAKHLNLSAPIVGIASLPNGAGYWLASSDGSVHDNSTHSVANTPIRLNQPIVGMAADPATGGYWLVAADGGIFAFNAPFFGSTGAMHLNQPIVGMTPAPDGNGYWLVARDGGVFGFGPGAAFHGSTGGMHLNAPIVAMTGQ